MEVERYANVHYPDLGLHTHYQKAHDRQSERTEPKTAAREDAFKQRTHAPSQKDIDHQTVKTIFAAARSEDRLNSALKEAGFQLYTRGQAEGVINLSTGRKYRLKTLGLAPALTKARSRMAVYADRTVDLEQWQHQLRNQTRGRDA